MTEAEMLEMAAIYTDNCMTIFNTYVSITFAYLVVAYLAGNKLSRLQAAVVTGLYLLTAAGCLAAIDTQLGAIVHFQAELGAEYDFFFRGGVPRATGMRYFTIPVMILGIFASLYFMFVEYREGLSDSLHVDKPTN